MHCVVRLRQNRFPHRPIHHRPLAGILPIEREFQRRHHLLKSFHLNSDNCAEIEGIQLSDHLSDDAKSMLQQ